MVGLGHIHVQYERRVGRIRVVNAGSVGSPYEGGAARSGRCSGRTSSSAHDYDFEADAAAIRATGYPDVEQLAGWLLDPPEARSEVVGALREPAWRVATSTRRAAASGRSASRIRPIIERLAAEHPDATIALRFSNAARAPGLGDALRADDRRERQPRDRAAVREVPPARGLPRRAAGGARARHLRDRLLPPEGEVAARDDAVLLEEFGGEVPRTIDGAAAPAGRRAQDGERRRGRARAARRGSSSTRTCAASRSASG